MSSVTRFLKQIPTDGQYFIPIPIDNNTISLQIFNMDPTSSTRTYVSGAAPGSFSVSNVTISTLSATDPSGFNDISGGTFLFRDMGKTIVSSARTFRRVQLLQLNGNITNGIMTGGWTSSNSVAGNWQPNNEGVTGTPSSNLQIDSDFGCFYFETGANGLGIAQGLIRYG